MNKYTLPSILFAAIILFSQCRSIDDIPTPQTIDFSCDDSPVVCSLTENNSEFAIDIFKSLDETEDADENIFISPFSISTALTMTSNGAEGETQSDMLSTLRTDDFSLEETNDSYQTLLEVLPALDPATSLKIANSVWPQSDFPISADFLDINTTKFKSEVIPVDFRDPTVVNQVNNWIEEKTNGLIQNAVDQLSPNAVMLLINAIYFKGSWKTEFDPEDTQTRDFNGNGGVSPVDMMHIHEGSFPYFANNLFQAVDLAYGDSIYSMSLFLPNEGHDVDDIIEGLNTDSYHQWISSFYSKDIELFLPKFEIEYDVKLKTNLSNLGMGIAFSDRADFTGINPNGGLLINDVIHKSFIQVDEVGTEAAAVTIVEIVVTSVPIIPVVNVNKPFVFVIRDNATKSILFMGKIVNL